MIWAILAALGVPLWLCAAGILALVLRNRALRRRYGDVPVRVRRPGKTHWTPGHGVWVADVFAWRGSPAAWKEELVEVSGASARDADDEERKKLHRLGDDPVICTLHVAGADTPLEFAASAAHRQALLGPFGADGGQVREAPPAVVRS